jgi:hypothetical protein
VDLQNPRRVSRIVYHLFPDAHAEGVAERVARAWDLSWPLPIPKDQRCHCGGLLVCKDWKFHRRTTGTAHPWRCDVKLKCIDCSVVPIYGVVVPKEMTPIRRGEWISWREGKEILADAGFFEGEPNGRGSS